MTEAEFIGFLDCNFPYENQGEAIDLIVAGAAISSNAAFMVLHEIARPPQSAHISKGRLVQLTRLFDEQVNHPLCKMMVSVAKKMIDGKGLSDMEAVEAMREVEKYRGEYSALSIICFSCEDSEGVVDSVCQEIVEKWRQ